MRLRLHVLFRIVLCALLSCGVLLWGVPTVINARGAHEKWFVSTIFPQLELLWSGPVLLMILLAVLAVGLLYALRFVVGGNNSFPSFAFLRYYDRSNQIILAVQAGIALIYVAAGLHVFAVNLKVETLVLALVLSTIQILVAFMFISGLLTRVGAVLLIVLYFGAFLFFPTWMVLEQTLYLGIAGYLLIMGRGLIRPTRHREPLAFFARYWPLAPTFLRTGVGISFLVLAFTEKLLNPGQALAFLHQYPAFNVARLLGFSWFTDDRFILAAGAVELTIGLALICGVLPKIVIMGMFVPVNLPLPFLPATELIGHLPIFATMYVLLFLPPPQVQEAMVAESLPVDERPVLEGDGGSQSISPSV